MIPPLEATMMVPPPEATMMIPPLEEAMIIPPSTARMMPPPSDEDGSVARGDDATAARNYEGSAGRGEVWATARNKSGAYGWGYTLRIPGSCPLPRTCSSTAPSCASATPAHSCALSSQTSS